MNKFEVGLFALAVLVGNYLGGLFGALVALCVCLMVSALLDVFVKRAARKHEFNKRRD